MELLFMEPVLKHNIWGGKKLREEYGYQEQGDDIGECWGISAHPNGDCQIKEGTYKGSTLSWLWQNKPELFGKTKEDTAGTVFPLLIKIIDAKDDLSIQVHPDDAYAYAHENHSLGKTECWYILDCAPDAELVIGHNARDQKELEMMIRGARWNDFIRRVPVKKGDFIQIDPGTVHAIKGGITLIETQQNSDITYRVYDYDRLSDGKPRELHIEKSIDVIKTPADDAQKSVIDTSNLQVNQLNTLYNCSYYQIFEIKVNGTVEFPKKVPYLLMSVVEGCGMVNDHSVKKGDHFIVPAGVEQLRCTGNFELIASSEPAE